MNQSDGRSCFFHVITMLGLLTFTGVEMLAADKESKTDPDVRLKETAASASSSLSTEDAKLRRYFVSVGKNGDERYLKGWQGAEVGELEKGNKNQTWRWSQEESQVRLPVLPGVPYQVHFRMLTSAYNLSATSGIYMGEQQLEPIRNEGFQTVSVSIPAQQGDEVVLRIVCKTFVPRTITAKLPNPSQDTRELGLCLTEIEVQAEGAEQLTRYDVCNSVFERKQGE